MRSSCCFLHASSLSFIILLVFTICSQDNYIYAHRIEWQEFRHLASGVGGESVTSATAVLWDNSSADDHSSETLKEKNSNSDEMFTNKEYKGRKQKKGFYMDCVPLDVCQYCTGDVTTAKSKNDEGTIVPVECMDTGKRQRFECIIEESETGEHIVIHLCYISLFSFLVVTSSNAELLIIASCAPIFTHTDPIINK